MEFSKELEQCLKSSDVGDNLLDNEFGELISSFLRKEKEEARIIFIRRYWYLDSISDIANKFNISESKVKSILFRTRNKLRFYLEKEGVNL
ncbi:sigma factor-like helix-turn-helix DNA-binding protein [uncultured Clostridium sp.]|uniref:RNA polymerase sigma factor n=1 Tax=uncultured Clostridium sp. TaxID=59620 RepID=UPI0025FB1D59|nr:sigma factor-like helix-turn-helix DNA-binding protein [uncultured Clostridium sp.]